MLSMWILAHWSVIVQESPWYKEEFTAYLTVGGL